MVVKIFFCYAREDEPLLNELKMHLEGMRRQGLIEMWHDRNISAGAEWEKEIDKYLDTADIILLLVSQYFMASDYCYGIEMQRAMERHERGETIVIPIILRPLDWHSTPFGKLQALPKDGLPITRWGNHDEAFYDVAEGIRKVVGELKILPVSTFQIQKVDNTGLNPYGGTLTLYDPLSDNSHGYGWSENTLKSTGGFTFKAGAYYGSLDKGKYITSLGGPSFKNFAMEAQITILKGGCGGVIFRADNAGYHYLFQVSPNGGYGIYLYFGSTGMAYKTLRSRHSQAIRTGYHQMNLLAAVAINQEIRFFVNRLLIYKMMDKSYSIGQCGFAIDSSGAIVGTATTTEVAFANLKVWTF